MSPDRSHALEASGVMGDPGWGGSRGRDVGIRGVVPSVAAFSCPPLA
jgi:hypothetical protein